MWKRGRLYKYTSIIIIYLQTGNLRFVVPGSAELPLLILVNEIKKINPDCRSGKDRLSLSRSFISLINPIRLYTSSAAFSQLKQLEMRTVMKTFGEFVLVMTVCCSDHIRFSEYSTCGQFSTYLCNKRVFSRVWFLINTDKYKWPTDVIWVILGKWYFLGGIIQYKELNF